MIGTQRDRYVAISLLSLAASGKGGETLEDIARAAGLEDCHAAVRIARRTLAESVGAGTWREARAEAAARLRAVASAYERARWKNRRRRWQPKYKPKRRCR